MILKLLRELMQPGDPEQDSCVAPADLNEVCPSLHDIDACPQENETRQLVEALYPELRRIAAFHMRRERWDHTWQPTSLVSEVFLKLAKNPNFEWRDQSHFLVAASKAMRLLLIDYARTHNAQHNSGQLYKIPLEEADAGSTDRSIEYLDLHRLLKKMATVDKRMSDVVELRIFGGLAFGEIGQVLGVHERTAKRDWQVAKAWLFGELRGGEESDGGGVGAD